MFYKRLLLLAFCLIGVFSGGVNAKEKTSIWEQKRSKEIFEIFTALSQGLCGEKLYDKGIRTLPKCSGVERAWLVSTLAEYHRRMRHEPVDGVILLAEEVLPKNESKAWLSKLNKAETERNRKFMAEKMQAMRDRKSEPEKPTGLAIYFPIQKVKANSTNAPAIMELARCLGQLGKIQDSLHLINACGVASNQSDDKFLLVQTHESLGDVKKVIADYGSAKNSYQAALGVFKHLQKEAARYDEKANYSKWEKAVKARLQKKAEIYQELETFGINPKSEPVEVK